MSGDPRRHGPADGSPSGTGGGPERRGFLDRPENVRRLFMAFYVLCGVLVALEVVIHRHETHPWEGLPAFYPLYGFVSIVVLVLVAKVLRRVVMRPEDYYEPEEERRGLG